MDRDRFIEEITQSFKVHPVVAILGPRQCGKTTLARLYADQMGLLPEENYFDLEDLNDLARLDHPQMALENLEGLIIIDEIQRKPELFQTLRVLVDRPGLKQQYLILGSASVHLLQQSSESLAGRIDYMELTPFSYPEVHITEKLWTRGGYPRSFLAQDDEASFLWRKSYVRTFLEQEIPSFGIQISPQQLRRFWMMLAHYHGQILNLSELGRSLGVSHTTIKNYTDILTNTLMVRQLQPWYANIGKRQVKSPKVYVRDSGILHTLLGCNTKKEVLTHPKLGSSWEGFALEEVIRFHRAEPFECYFWATQSEAEVDLLIVKGGKKLAFEFKYSDSPKITPSMQKAIEILQLDELVVIYPGKKSFSLTDKIRAAAFESYLGD